MSTAPTGAARTALPTNEALDKRAAHIDRQTRAASDSLRFDAMRDEVFFYETREQQHAATLSHLAGQAGPEVRGLVLRFGELSFAAGCASETQDDYGDETVAAAAAETALLAAYAAKDAELATVPRLKACEQVLLHLHEQLGIKWGDDPYAALGKAQAEAAALRQQRDEALWDRDQYAMQAASERQRADSMRDWFIETIYETENNPAMTVAELLRRMRHVMDDPELNKPSQYRRADR